MTAPTRWTIVEAGEELTGPIRLLDWEREREVNAVRKTWWRSMRMKPKESRFPLMSDILGAEDYWGGGLEARDGLMRRGVRVAVTESGHTLLGWACVEPTKGVVHYVYVSESMRRRGLGRQLVADMAGRDRVWFSMRTYEGSLVRLPETWKFSGWRAF